MLNTIKHHFFELTVLIGLLLSAAIIHGANMFNFPYYNNDEGTYISQAWSLLSQGKLSPYTYWYDHAPLGWILISIWVKLTGGFFTFDTAINSGRVLILLLFLISVILLFYIAKRLSGNIYASIITVIIFAFSPLEIYFGRRVLLDNIMYFWVFLSLALLTPKKLKLSYIVLSATAFGIAILTKENAIFFTPGLLYAVYLLSHSYNKGFAIAKWVFIFLSVVSMYILYSLLQGEFFPIGFLGNYSPHVSLIVTIKDQLSRGVNLPFWDRESDFYTNMTEWVTKDSFTIILGIISTILATIFAIWDKRFRVPALLSIFFWAFLIRGALVIDFYITPLIPVLALNAGLVLDYLIQNFTFRKNLLYCLLSLAIVFSISFTLLNNHQFQFTKDESLPQREAINWIKQNIPPKANIVIDDSLYVDLHESRFTGDPIFPNATWAFKVELDDSVKQSITQGDWKNIEYLTLGHEILEQVKNYNFKLLKQFLNHSILIADWKQGSSSYFDLNKYISTNGDWMSVYQLKSKEEITLDAAWQYYRISFIHSYGQIVDPSTNKTTSEGQSYALLRAVYQDDKNTFDGVWNWTRDHLEFRQNDKLISWWWGQEGNQEKVIDPSSASDADEDIALSLLFAYKKWHDPSYLVSAKAVISDIWNKEVIEINGNYYFTSSSDAKRPDGYLVNPSYLSPASYKIFAQVDYAHNWEKLASDSYLLLNQLNNYNKNQINLPPNWILINKNTGRAESAKQYINSDIDSYGFDAFRAPFRVTLDYLWFNNFQAKQYLQSAQPFFEKEWAQYGNFAAIYGLDGTRQSSYSSISTDMGPISTLYVTHPELENQIFNKLIGSQFNYNQGYWGDKNNYYDQNWAWFGTLLQYNHLINLWNN